MTRIVEGQLSVGDRAGAVVVARFNALVTERLLAGAETAWRRHGGDPDRLTVVHVPGAFELPVVARRLALAGEVASVTCLGCVIRGETDHYDHVVHGALDGIAAIGRETGIPVTLGVITAGSLEQALERAGGKAGNQGEHAMRAAIETADVLGRL